MKPDPYVIKPRLVKEWRWNEDKRFMCGLTLVRELLAWIFLIDY